MTAGSTAIVPQKRYKGSLTWVPYVELGLGLHFTAMAVYAMAARVA